jgi:hypothetical protein
MTNQQIVWKVEEALPESLPDDIKEKILDAVQMVLNDHLGIDPEPEEE